MTAHGPPAGPVKRSVHVQFSLNGLPLADVEPNGHGAQPSAKLPLTSGRTYVSGGQIWQRENDGTDPSFGFACLGAVFWRYGKKLVVGQIVICNLRKCTSQ